MGTFRRTGTYTGSGDAIVDLAGFNGPIVSILISGNATVYVTNDTTPATTTLWSELTLTNNACSVTGPISGVKFSHTGNGSFAVMGRST